MCSAPSRGHSLQTLFGEYRPLVHRPRGPIREADEGVRLLVERQHGHAFLWRSLFKILPGEGARFGPQTLAAHARAGVQ